MHPRQFPSRHRQVARHFGADGQAYRIVFAGERLHRDVFPYGRPGLEHDAFLLHQTDAAVDNLLAQLEVRYPEAQQPSGQFVLFVHRNSVSLAVQPVGRCQSGGPAAHHRYLEAVAHRFDRLDIALAESCLGNGRFVFADGNRFVGREFEHAALLAQRRADASGELRKIAGLFQDAVSLFDAPPVEQILPFGLAVAHRTGPVAERHPAVHAARSLRTAVGGIEGLFDFAVIVYAVVYRTVTCFEPVHGQKCFRISHIFG